MKFVRDLIVFAVVFFGTYMLVTYLMKGGSVTNQEIDNAICYTVGATTGWGLVAYFKQKKQKENK